jgi:hypothetical protein
MNQDLDDRLIPSNEYRSARNISIISSDSSNTGAIENILGNVRFSNLGNVIGFSQIIGYISDSTSNSVYVFATNYTDTPDNQLDNPPQYQNYGDSHKIAKVNLTTGVAKVLVSGSFLNFSTTHPITGINLFENLLFWTDNRNQPRKINVQTAFNNPNLDYYTKEEHISVAKYAPVSSIKFIDNSECTMKDVVSEYLPDGVTPNPYWINNGEVPPVGNYAGDPTFLQDKFVRFSYRFRFDDGEYSILAPFSQIAFIPQQDGSFLDGDEDNSYRNTIVAFMRNKVNQINLILPMPVTCDNLFNEFKITEIDILYKESDGLSVQVLDTIMESSFRTVTDNYYTYDYQSRKPIRTLPGDQLIRVSDKTPVRALAQETAGGRIIYGNYIDKNTPPSSIDYSVSTSLKTEELTTQYPLHTVKQNRNYQVGIVLSDKFGRQSDVILSPVIEAGVSVPDAGFFGSSSFYAPYLSPSPNIVNFFGNSIKVLFSDYILSDKSQLNDLGIPATGEPGLYEAGGGLLSYAYIIEIGVENTNTLGSDLTDGTYTNVPVTQYGPSTGATMTVVVSGGQMVVASSVITLLGSGITVNQDILINLPDQPEEAILPVMTATNVTEANPTGWYSYKIVVKQNQQEYYNVYIPGSLSGYPEPDEAATDPVTFPVGEENKTSNLVLFSDNINKVPRDLSEVGPDQKQYRSSVVLFGRVENNSATTNAQFFPTNKGFSVTTLANAVDLEMTATKVTTPLYQLNTNPIIGRISTNGAGSFGVAEATFEPILSVLETAPVISNLDIYWETSTTGLISDLNYLISQTKPGAYSFVNVNYLQTEAQDPGGDDEDTGDEGSKYVTDPFYPVNFTSQRLNGAVVSLISVVDDNGNNITTDFGLELTTTAGKNSYRIIITDSFYFNPSINLNNFTFTLAVYDDVSDTTNNLIIKGGVSNIPPQMVTYDIKSLYSGKPAPYVITNTVSGVNGSFATSTKTLDLKWSFLNGQQTYAGGAGENSFTLSIDQTTGELKLLSGDPIIAFDPGILLTDSGNKTDTFPLILDFRQGEFDPANFNLDFNL